MYRTLFPKLWLDPVTPGFFVPSISEGASQTQFYPSTPVVRLYFRGAIASRRLIRYEPLLLLIVEGITLLRLRLPLRLRHLRPRFPINCARQSFTSFHISVAIHCYLKFKRLGISTRILVAIDITKSSLQVSRHATDSTRTVAGLLGVDRLPLI